MGQYCDSVKLERNWFHWLLSSSVPDLEKYREHGLLWTKIVGNDVDEKGNILYDPRNPNRAHCIALAVPIHLTSYNGTLSNSTVLTADGPIEQLLPGKDELNLLSASWLHELEHPFTQRDKVIPSLENDEYFLELPTEMTWHAVLEDVNNICHGIAMRFKQPSEEEHLELSNDALLQVINKLASYKLVYTPGRAPVFNLLTTTIHRCMYSIMNRRKIQRQGLQKLQSDVKAGMPFLGYTSQIRH